MQQYLDQLWQIIQTQLQSNQFLTGGAFLMIVGGLAAYLRNTPGKIWDWIKGRAFVEFEIPMKDEAFLWFNDWLAAQPYSKNWARWLSVRTIRKRGQDDWDDPCFAGEDDRRKPTFILSPAPGVHWLWWHGYFIVVERERKEPEPSLMGGGTKSVVERECYNISVLTWRRDVIFDLLQEAHKLSEPPEDERLRIHFGRYGEWHNEIKRRPRPTESVIMPEGTLESLLDDAKKFIRGEKWYVERGIPYRRGYLLYGPPGNGKSSAVMALASELKLEICVLSLSGSSMGDDELRRLLSDLPSDSAIVLIEDVDCVFDQRESAENKDSKITFSGLLNAIDGVVAAEGRILVMTTNFPDKLDAALVRPGRCDVKLLIKNADEDQARRLFLRFYEGQEALAKEFGVLVGSGQFSMAKLQGHLLKHAERSPQDAITNITELLHEPQTAEGPERTKGEFGVQADKAGGSVGGADPVHQDSVT